MSSYSANNNQNIFVSETGRTTSRVLNPPGGVSSFSIGCDVPPPKPKPTASPLLPTPPVVTENSLPSGKEPETPTTEETEPVPTSTCPLEIEASKTPRIGVTDELSSSQPSKSPSPLLPMATTVPVSSNAFASGANMNGANVMTGRPTSRVLAPPGGHSALGGSLW